MTGTKLRFIKPCRESDSSPPLTPLRVKNNKDRQTETSLLLDLNILIRMEDVLLKGKNPADLGLMELVNLINQCPPESICLSPGFALSEVHPKFKKQCFEIYEVFLSIFCPEIVDHPNATRNSGIEPESVRKPSFHELSIGEQYLHAASYYSLIQIHIINSKYSYLSGYEKFNIYLDAVCNDIDVISAVEAEIAKYCFCKKEEHYSQLFKNRIGYIKENFLDKNKEPKKHLLNIFNGVQDLQYGKAALKYSGAKFDGKNQETWVATLDSKLYWLSESIHHYPVPGEEDGKHYSIVRNFEQESCDYWRNVDQALHDREEAREKERRTTEEEIQPNVSKHEEGFEKLHRTLLNKGFTDFSTQFVSKSD